MSLPASLTLELAHKLYCLPHVSSTEHTLWLQPTSRLKIFAFPQIVLTGLYDSQNKQNVCVKEYANIFYKVVTF